MAHEWLDDPFGIMLAHQGIRHGWTTRFATRPILSFWTQFAVQPVAQSRTLRGCSEEEATNLNGDHFLRLQQESRAALVAFCFRRNKLRSRPHAPLPNVSCEPFSRQRKGKDLELCP